MAPDDDDQLKLISSLHQIQQVSVQGCQVKKKVVPVVSNYQACRFRRLLLMILTAIPNYYLSFQSSTSVGPSTAVGPAIIMNVNVSPLPTYLYNDDDSTSPSVYYQQCTHRIQQHAALCVKYLSGKHHLLELTTKPTLILFPGYLSPYCTHHLLLDHSLAQLACPIGGPYHVNVYRINV